MKAPAPDVLNENDPADVPSPIDLRCVQQAYEWAETVNLKRPWR